MKFTNPMPFLDRAGVTWPENSVLEVPDDWNGIPSPDWRPLDEKAKAKLEAVPAEKAKAKAAAEQSKNAIPKYEIVEAPGAKKTEPEKPAQLTIRQAATSDGGRDADSLKVTRRAADRKPV